MADDDLNARGKPVRNVTERTDSRLAMSNVDDWCRNERRERREITKKREDETGIGHGCPETHAHK